MKKRKGVSYAKYGYIFSIPFLVAYLVFNLYPTIYTVILGFTKTRGIKPKPLEFLKGDELFKNFKTVLIDNETFRTSFGNTVLIFVLNFIPQLALALLLTAWFTSPRCKIRGQGFFKVMFYMPNIITAATIAMLFSVLFNRYGAVNDLLKTIGAREKPYDFLQDKTWTRGIIAFIQFWMWYGYTAIIFISGVLGINPEIFEAAEIDGANGRQTFWRITLPNLKSIMLYMLITSLIGGLGMYDIPYLFNKGGPGGKSQTIAMFIKDKAFGKRYLYDEASAASMIVFVVIIILSGIIFFMMRDRDAIKQKKADKAAEKARLKELKKKGVA